MSGIQRDAVEMVRVERGGANQDEVVALVGALLSVLARDRAGTCGPVEGAEACPVVWRRRERTPYGAPRGWR
ncbi:hypothetical protein ABZ776_21370 [Streptomyces sp. NPDC007076]|uniref:hypothetical protein n=1 Tax=unclassified Streptomyces TaxID=2593676 RepID=UPI002E78AF97|nr:hypothetical protein [Streptomyces sp. JV190]MEE1840007.1 hypothetical protein [Streptomyces sp. JV190]